MTYFSFQKWEEKPGKIYSSLITEKKNLKHLKCIVDIYLNLTSHLDFSAFMTTYCKSCIVLKHLLKNKILFLEGHILLILL